MTDEPGESADRAFIQHIAQRDLPRTLLWLGFVILAFGIVDLIVPPRTPLDQFAGVMVIGAIVVGASFVLRRPGIPAWCAPWTFSVMLSVLVCWLLYIYVQEPIPSNLSYVIVVTTFFGPLTFGWRPFLFAAFVIVAAVAYAMAQVDLEGAVDWSIGIVASLVVSGVLLSLRLRLLRELAASERRNELLSTSDALTGLLNRRGLEQRLPTLWADAKRRGEPIRVCFLDVRGLKRANDEHGHDFGDLVITDVADAIAATIRAGDLVARWGGDEFVTVGVGSDSDVGTLGDRLNEYLKSHGRASKEHWSGDVTVGIAASATGEESFESLVERADVDMYARRRPAAADTGR
jgi:diguanylate cyclase (GGDEF)-like protein